MSGDMNLFGRRITRSGWLKLGGLASVVLFIVFIFCAPLVTISVKIDLPPASANLRPATSSDWLTFFAWLFGAMAAVIVLIGMPIWLVVRAARKIIQAQPKANP
jgi:hypothetical protein